MAKDTEKLEEDVTPVVEQLYEPIIPEDPMMEPISEADEIQHKAFDKYILAKVCIPQGDNLMYGTVKHRARDSDGELIEKSNKNPLLDTAVYKVEFDNGNTNASHLNIIAESIYAQMDNDGYATFILKEIVDHKLADSAVKVQYAYYVNKATTKKRLKVAAMCQLE